MPVGVQGVGAATGTGSSTLGATASVTPNLPATAAADNRIYVATVSIGAVSAPSVDWTEDLASAALGGGVAGNNTGTRQFSVFHRDYDGVWTMPSFTSAAVAGIGPSIEVASIAFNKDPSEVFNPPTVGSGSDATSHSAFSVTTGSFADPTGGIAWLIWGWPGSPSSLASLTLSAPGATFAGNTSRHGFAGQTAGNDSYLATWTYPVTVGATAAHTSTLTGGVSRTSGVAVLSQTVSLAHPLGPVVLVSNPAALRAATR